MTKQRHRPAREFQRLSELAKRAAYSQLTINHNKKLGLQSSPIMEEELNTINATLKKEREQEKNN